NPGAARPGLRFAEDPAIGGWSAATPGTFGPAHFLPASLPDGHTGHFLSPVSTGGKFCSSEAWDYQSYGSSVGSYSGEFYDVGVAFNVFGHKPGKFVGRAGDHGTTFGFDHFHKILVLRTFYRSLVQLCQTFFGHAGRPEHPEPGFGREAFDCVADRRRRRELFHGFRTGYTE